MESSFYFTLFEHFNIVDENKMLLSNKLINLYSNSYFNLLYRIIKTGKFNCVIIQKISIDQCKIFVITRWTMAAFADRHLTEVYL